MTDGGLSHHVGGKPPETSVIREVMEAAVLLATLSINMIQPNQKYSQGTGDSMRIVSYFDS